MAGGEGLTMTLTAALLLSFLAGLLLAAGVYALLRAVLALLLAEWGRGQDGPCWQWPYRGKR
jgi:hypothetical protein